MNWKISLKIRSVTASVLAIAMLFCTLAPTQAYAEEIKDNTVENQLVRVGFYQMDGYQELSEDGSRSGFGYEMLMMLSKYIGFN